jgi:hypothetical protein
MTLISSISKEKRTKWMMHPTGECMNYMLQPFNMYQIDIKGRISEDENVDLKYMEFVKKLQQGKMLQKVEYYKLEVDGTLLYKNIIYVPNFPELRIMILKEMHNVPYVGHPGYQKTVTTVKSH